MTRRNSGDYAVVWPRSAKAVEIKPLAKRLDALDGKTIAFLWDDLFRGDEIWPILKEELGKRFTGRDASSTTMRSARRTATRSTRARPNCRARSSR